MGGERKRDKKTPQNPPPPPPPQRMDVSSALARLAVVPLALVMAAQILANNYDQVTGEETHGRSICLKSKPLFHLTLIKKKFINKPQDHLKGI